MSRANRPVNRAALSITAGLLVILGVVAAGCGGGSDGSSATTTGGADTAAETTSGGNADLVKESKRIVTEAQSNLVRATGDATGELDPAAIRGIDAFEGPAPTPPPSDQKKAFVINCLPVGTCPYVGGKVAEILKKFGWDVNTIDTDAGPETAQSAWATAISQSPDVIISTAIPSSFISAELQKAKAAGIMTVDAFQSERSGEGYDAYIDYAQQLQQQLVGAAIIAESGGGVEVGGVEVDGFPDYGIEGALEYVELCEDCSTTATSAPVTAVIDPIKSEQKVSSFLQENPDLSYLVWPGSSLPLEPVIGAIDRAGKSEQTKVVNADAQPPSLKVLAAGDSPFQSFVPAEWVALATVDAALKLIAGEAVPPAEGWGLAAYLWTPKNLPSKLTFDAMNAQAREAFDFAEPYESAWGIKLGQ